MSVKLTVLAFCDFIVIANIIFYFLGYVP